VSKETYYLFYAPPHCSMLAEVGQALRSCLENTFSKVSVLVHLLYKVTNRDYFRNVLS